MQIVLVVAGLGSIWPLKDTAPASCPARATLFNAVLGLQQEGKAAQAVAALQKMMIIKAKVRRDGRMAELPAEQLVPGDVVNIEAGTSCRRRPAAAGGHAGDRRGGLTARACPFPRASTRFPAGDAARDRTDMVYMNTNVTRGAGTFVVTATGMSTRWGTSRACCRRRTTPRRR